MGRMSALPRQPPYNRSDFSGTPLKLEAIRVSCLHYPSEEDKQVPLLPAFPPQPWSVPKSPHLLNRDKNLCFIRRW